MILPEPEYTNNSEEVQELLRSIRKAIDQKDAAELLRLEFICSGIYGMVINEDGSLTPICQ